MIYTSKDNPLIKTLRSLKDKKGRREHKLYIAEGQKLLDAAVMYNRDIKYVVVREGYAFSGNMPRIDVSGGVFDTLSDEKSPQGILAVIGYDEKQLPDIAESCVISDGVSDPKNLGAIIRTAAACGVNNLILCGDSADVYSPKTVRASMGGLFCINVYRAEREQVLKRVKSPLICADLGGENIFKLPPVQNFALVIGNEANGVSGFFRENCKMRITLPMENNTESLNAAVAAGIILYRLKYGN